MGEEHCGAFDPLCVICAASYRYLAGFDQVAIWTIGISSIGRLQPAVATFVHYPGNAVGFTEIGEASIVRAVWVDARMEHAAPATIGSLRRISLTVTPRLDPTKTLKGTIRRSKSPFANPLNN